MNTQRLTSTYYDLTHGWHGFLVFYVLIAIFSLAGLKRARAGFDEYLYWPFTSLFTMEVVGLSLALLRWILVSVLGLQLTGIGEDLFGVIVTMLGGFVGGVYWASRGAPLKAIHGRGAVVVDGADAKRHAPFS